MKIHAQFALVFTAGAAFIPCMAKSSDYICPSTVDQAFCEQLDSRSNDELVSFYLMFNRAPIDSSDTDPIKDTAALPNNSGTPLDYEAYTQDLFGNYDLRWPEDPGTRASAPTQIEGTYRLFATKSTILALSAENYIQEVQRWSPDAPTGIKPLLKTGPNPQASRQLFNVIGQRMIEPYTKAATHKFRFMR